MEWAGVRELVERARNGDAAAVERLYALARPYLLALAQKLLGPGWPHKSISDLMQETWARAWKGLPGFTGAESDDDTAALLRAWLARTMKNVRLNEARFDAATCRGGPLLQLPLGRASDSVGSDPPARDATPSEAARQDERLDLVRRALGELPTADAELVRLRFFDGLSFDEVGQHVGRDESTVRHHLQRILKRLGGELKGLQ